MNIPFNVSILLIYDGNRFFAVGVFCVIMDYTGQGQGDLQQANHQE